MPSAVEVTTSEQLEELKRANAFVVASFYNNESKTSLPTFAFEKMGRELYSPGFIAFAKIDADRHRELADSNEVTSLPTCLVWRKDQPTTTTKADLRDAPQLVSNMLLDYARSGNGDASSDKIAQPRSAGAGAGSGDSAAGASAAAVSGASSGWRGASLPRGYGDVTDQIDPKGREALNADTDFGSIRDILSSAKPTALGGKASGKDWIESDTDDQLMIFLPFQSMIKLHTLQITSLPPADVDDDERPMRPKTIKLFTNKPHNLGFDQGESEPPTQQIILGESDWKDGTANIPLRFVKFQNITSLVIFVVNGDGESEKVRVDRIRLIGETGEKREMGKLEKVGEGEE